MSHNRAEELKRTFSKIRNLDPLPDEVRLVLDRCTDDSEAVVRRIFPDAIISATQLKGSIPNRDRIIRDTDCDLVLSLDDDSYPLESNSVDRIREFGESFKDVGVFTFPQISDEFPEVRDLGKNDRKYVGSYANSGAVIRKAAYMETEGYAVLFEHAYEEPDFVLQLMDKGWKAMETRTLTIRHHYSRIERNEMRTHLMHARNEFLSSVLRTPVFVLPITLIRVVLSQSRYAVRRGWILHEWKWWIGACIRLVEAFKLRTPVSWAAYSEWRKVLHRPIEIKDELLDSKLI
ncbi:MAG: glycosyltransferase family 2 protein [Opitutales bacterium]